MNIYNNRVVEERVVHVRPALYNVATVASKEVVCAYTRVSTDSDEQETSFELQCDYYTKLINGRPDWDFGGVYADQGISGTRAQHRPSFMKMIQDARDGKINRILVKSLSRFARNTVDALMYIRELKELGVAIYFEMHNIDTMTPGGEIMITVLAACAEQESRTMSNNIKWAFQKRFAQGRVVLNCSHMLGYGKVNGEYEIVPEEGMLISRIYRSYLSGMTDLQIAQQLTAENVLTPSGKPKWAASSIQRILTNEKYTGNAILGKTFKPDVLSGKRLKNEGQVPSYYVENSHPAIVSQEVFNMAQAERKRRGQLQTTQNTGIGKYTSKYVLSGLLFCTCGSKFRRYRRSLADGTKVITWVCITHQNEPSKCQQLPLKEDDILSAYEKVMGELIGDVRQIREDVRTTLDTVLEQESQQKCIDIAREIEAVQHRMMDIYNKRNNGEVDDATYTALYKQYSNKVSALICEEEKYKAHSTEQQIAKMKHEEINALLSQDKINYLDHRIMRTLVDKIVVLDKNTLEIILHCGISRRASVTLNSRWLFSIKE